MKTISFSGIDGCGKTTQVDLLVSFLRERGIDLQLIHLLSKKQTTFSKFHESRGIKQIIYKIRSLKDNPLGIFLKVSLRLANVLLDSWITTALNKFRYRNKVLVYDRYFYDVVVILAFSYPKLSDFIMRFISFIPKPKKIMIFDIDPEVAVMRKQGHSLDEAKRYCNLYKDLFKKVEGSLLIESELGIDEISEKIKRYSVSAN